MTDFYELLRIGREASFAEISAAIAAPPPGIAGDVLADARLALGDPLARANYDRALASDLAARREFELREAAYLRGDLPRALRHAVRLTEFRPDDPESWLQAAVIAEAMDEHATAARIAEGGAKLHPSEARLWHRGAISRCADAIEKADEGTLPDFGAGLALMERAVEADPGTRLYEYEHVRLLASCGRPLEAIQRGEAYVFADRAVGFDDLPFLQLLFDLHMRLDLDLGMRGTAAALVQIGESEPERRPEIVEAMTAQITVHLANGGVGGLHHLVWVAANALGDPPADERGAEAANGIIEAEAKIRLAEELPILRDDPSLVAQAAAGFVLIALGREEEARPYRERDGILHGGITSLPTEAVERDLERLRERYPATWATFGERLEAIFAPGFERPGTD